jgi:hypothetical protein
MKRTPSCYLTEMKEGSAFRAAAAPDLETGAGTGFPEAAFPSATAVATCLTGTWPASSAVRMPWASCREGGERKREGERERSVREKILYYTI